MAAKSSKTISPVYSVLKKLGPPTTTEVTREKGQRSKRRDILDRHRNLVPRGLPLERKFLLSPGESIIAIHRGEPIDRSRRFAATAASRADQSAAFPPAAYNPAGWKIAGLSLLHPGNRKPRGERMAGIDMRAMRWFSSPFPRLDTAGEASEH